MSLRKRFRDSMINTYRRIDKKRIQLHLRRAEKELRRKDTDLESPLAERRKRNLDRLNSYWKAGDFPVNKDSSSRIPVFKDGHGVPCAMAYLMEQDGEQEIVDDVADSDNNVLIEGIDDGPVAEWIEKSGLTKEEAARIQPNYGPSYTVASTCDPLTCSTLQIIMVVFAAAAFGLFEWIGYNYASSLFPENALKKRATFGYFSVMNVLLASGLSVLVYAFFP